MNRDIERMLYEIYDSIPKKSELKSKIFKIYKLVEEDICKQELQFTELYKKIQELIELKTEVFGAYMRCSDKYTKIKKENQRLKNFIISLIVEYELEEWLTKEHQELWEMLNDKKGPYTDSESN